MKVPRRCGLAFLFLVCFTVASPALAGTAWVSVPSAPNNEGKFYITAGNLPPAETVILKITQGEGAISEQYINVSAEGTMSIAYFPITTGVHTVEVRAQDGGKFGGGNFFAQQ